MYEIKIDGISDFSFKTENFDDAETVSSLIIEYGKRKVSDYGYDDDGNYTKIGEHIERAKAVLSIVEEVTE